MSDSLGYLLTDVARMLRREFDARMRIIGVTRHQGRVLTVLARHEGINQSSLADYLEVEAITIARMVDRLQDAGLVERRADPADRRAWRLYLTPRSHSLKDDLIPIARKMMKDTLKGFTDAEKEILLGYLERVHTNLSRDSRQET